MQKSNREKKGIKRGKQRGQRERGERERSYIYSEIETKRDTLRKRNNDRERERKFYRRLKKVEIEKEIMKERER